MMLAHRVGALDNTREPAMPRVGGWCVAFGAAASLLLVGVIFAPTGLTLAGFREPFAAVAAGSVAILLLGTIDDIQPLPAAPKFLIQIAIALGVYFLGVRVGALSLPMGSVQLGSIASAVLTVLWLV